MCMLSSRRLCNRLPKLGVKHILCKAVTPDIELESKFFLVILKLTFGVLSQAFSKKKVTDRKDWLSRAMEERKWRRQQGLPEVGLVHHLTL